MLLIKTSELQQSVGLALTDAEESVSRLGNLVAEMVNGIMNDGEYVSKAQQKQVRAARRDQAEKLAKLIELRDYVKFAEESGIETLHLSVEMFALVKHNLPAR